MARSVILRPLCWCLYSSCSVLMVTAGHRRGLGVEKEAWVPQLHSSNPVPMSVPSDQVLDDPAEDNLYLGE